MGAIHDPIRKGDVLLLSIALRAQPGEPVTIGFGPAHPAAAPRKSWEWSAPDDEWRRVDIPFTAERPYAVNEAAVTVWLGPATGACNVGPTSLVNYRGSVEIEDLIASACRAGIEVEVVDAHGLPVSGAEIELVQTLDAFGGAVDPQQPPYEGLAVGEGGYGVPHLIALRALDGGRVNVQGPSQGAKLTRLMPDTKRNPGRFPFSGIPTRLRGLTAVTVDRGDPDAPGRGYSITVDRPVEAYLFVEHLGEPDLGGSWEPTAMQATWGTTEWQVTDRVFVGRFNAGRIDIPPHTGSDEPWWTRVSGETNDQGLFVTDAYKGVYRITVRHGGQTHSREIALSDGSETLEFRLP